MKTGIAVARDGSRDEKIHIGELENCHVDSAMESNDDSFSFDKQLTSPQLEHNDLMEVFQPLYILKGKNFGEFCNLFTPKLLGPPA